MIAGADAAAVKPEQPWRLVVTGAEQLLNV